jgi:predicted Zn-dependent protease with MMP-like domain
VIDNRTPDMKQLNPVRNEVTPEMATNIRVEDFPTDEVLHRMRAFRGVGLPFQFESAPMRMPNMIWLYRRPILAYWSRHQDTLEAIITHVLVHEIGHHFGFSDDDMHGIEDRAD